MDQVRGKRPFEVLELDLSDFATYRELTVAGGDSLCVRKLNV